MPYFLFRIHSIQIVYQSNTIEIKNNSTPSINSHPLILNIFHETGQPICSKNIILHNNKLPPIDPFPIDLVTQRPFSVELILNSKSIYFLGRISIVNLETQEEYKTLTFAHNNLPFTFKLNYTISKLKHYLQFSILKIHCLELNKNSLIANQIHETSHDLKLVYNDKNSYSLGTINTHQISHLYSNFNCTIQIVESKWNLKFFSKHQLIQSIDFEFENNKCKIVGKEEFLLKLNQRMNKNLILEFKNNRFIIEYSLLFLNSEIVTNEDTTSLLETQLFNTMSANNQVQILIDGLETFEKMYYEMKKAKQSIHILAWELSLTFGLLFLKESKTWITLQDVLLDRAKQGVKIRCMVWRHQILSYLNRFLYMGHFTIEQEVKALEKKAKALHLKVAVFHTDFNLPNPETPFADPFAESWDVNQHANIVIVIVGNPKGLVSCHHEKLVLIDAEDDKECVGFLGGFDMARGRFDQPLHQTPLPLWDLSFLFNNNNSNHTRYGDKTIQPWIRFIRFLWHDQQVMVKGPSTRALYYHFAQRWSYAFCNHIHLQWNQKYLQIVETNSSKQELCNVQILRGWPGILHTSHVLLDNFSTMIKNAKNYIYMEHQYAFQNHALTQVMCETLKSNPNLKLIIMSPIKTDLPSGVIGNWLDMSQDHINSNLNQIYEIAPKRVGIYGLVKQDRVNIIKSIYIHSKLMIIDGQIMCIGSSNLDNMSFYNASELNMNIHNSTICEHTLYRLVREHLELFDSTLEQVQEQYPTMDHIFEAFFKASEANYHSLTTNGKLVNRLFSLMPRDYYHTICNYVNYPTFMGKWMFKMGYDQSLLMGMKQWLQNLKQERKEFELLSYI